MKNIKEISKDLDCTIQTVYNHIKKNDKELKGCIVKVQNVTHLTDEGIRILKESMNLIQLPTKRDLGIEEMMQSISNSVTENVSNSINITINQKMDNLESQIQELKQQNKLLIEMQQENNYNRAKILELENNDQKEKRGLFGWFKK